MFILVSFLHHPYSENDEAPCFCDPKDEGLALLTSKVLRLFVLPYLFPFVCVMLIIVCFIYLLFILCHDHIDRIV
jgi:hypothetical protein